MSAGRPPLSVPPASSSSSDKIAVQNLLDSLGADIILRSSDSFEVRVPKLYIAEFSTVLGELIQGATNSSVPSNAQAPLPIVQLPESVATLISLLSFMFPLAPALPSTSAIEETMEILSAAQKYKMSSVLAHIRLILTQQYPHFIYEDNAFRAYSLAQKNGLRQEAVEAAQLTLKKGPLNFHTLEGELDIMPGAFLYELWAFHERFRTCFMSDLKDFGKSGELKGLKCIRRDPSGIPSWLENYFRKVTEVSVPPDFYDFQNAWVMHLRQCECIRLPEIFHEVWTDINAVVCESMEKAENNFSIVGGETHSEGHIRSPTAPLSLPKCMDVSRADAIVRSSDDVDFRVHQSILASSSPVFKDMFSLPQPSDSDTVDGLPMVRLTEDAELVRALITTLYPIPSDLPTSYHKILALLAAAQKYDMDAVQSSIRAEVIRRKIFPSNVFRAYAMASRWRLIPEMNMAARLSLNLVMTLPSLGVELRLFEGWALRALINFRILYRDNLITCLRSFLDIRTSPSKIWIACPGQRPFPYVFEEYVQDRPANSSGSRGLLSPRINVDRPGGSEAAQNLPVWLHNVFMNEIKSAKTRAPEFPLVRPSDIRAKYLSAMQKHVSTDKCSSCLEVHAMDGEKYIVELERALAQARDNTTLDVS